MMAARFVHVLMSMLVMISVHGATTSSLPSGLVMENVPDSKRTYTTSHGASCSRAMIDSSGGFCQTSGGSTTDPMLINLPQDWIVAGVVTQGRLNTNQWIRSYKVQYENEGGNFVWVTDSDGNPAVFTGNTDHNTKVYNTFDAPIRTSKVKIFMATFSAHASYRSALLVPEARCPADVISATSVAASMADTTASSLCAVVGTNLPGCGKFCDDHDNMPDPQNICPCHDLADDVLFAAAGVCNDHAAYCDDSEYTWLHKLCARTCCFANKR